MLRRRLSRLMEAILRISEELDLDTVLQEVVYGARVLTNARYSAITTIDDSGKHQDMLLSGVSAELKQYLMTMPDRLNLFRYLTGFEKPLRTPDFATLIKESGFNPDMLPISTFLGIRIRDGDRHIGNIFLGEKESGQDFTPEDEETLQMFATQAATAITNARRYGAEQRANADLEALINTSPVGVLVFDAATGDVMKLNREARRLLGVVGDDNDAFQQLLSRLTFRRLDGVEIKHSDLPMKRAIESGEATRAEEIVIQLPDGTSVTTLFNTTPIHAEDGSIVSVVATIQDISPLEELERLRSEFLGMVSHELRMPLTSIKGSAATASNASVPLDPTETRQFFRIIEEQADNMRDLINSFLDLTRVEAGTLSVVPEPSDLPAIIEQARHAFQSSGYRNSIEIDPMPNLPRVEADRQRLVQVLFNLFSNASKYSREWSTIKVTASIEEMYAVVSVADEGVGVPSEQLPRVFSKFSRFEGDGGDRRIQGHGLGLAICKGIIEAHGGRIWAESDGPGHGARLTFTIPTIEEAGNRVAEYRDETTSSVTTAPSMMERILAVDDDPHILRYVRSTLSDAGYTPIVTTDPEEMPRLLREEQPHLVLLNLVLPGTDGFALMKRIPNTSEIPVIILSGRGRGQDIARAFELGAADYVVKPFSPTELVARISAALRRREVSQRTEPYLLRDLVIDYVNQQVTVAGRRVQLTPTEYKLLYELAISTGRVVPHQQLLNRVWDGAPSGEPALLRTYIKSLRQKLGDDARNPSYILTEPRVGYRMATP